MANVEHVIAEKKFITDFIRLYKSLPALWNKRNKRYYNVDQKENAYRILIKKYREVNPIATKDDVKRKINSLRTNYRKELVKHLNSFKGEEGVYTPKLWYFNEFEFLRHLSQTDSETENGFAAPQVSEFDSFEAEYLETDESGGEDRKNMEPVTTWEWGAEDITPQDIESTPPKRRQIDVTNCRSIATSEDVCDIKDEYYYWAMAWAADLRKMDPTQRLYAKKAISDVLIEGQFGQLHRDSVKINEDSQNQCSSSQSIIIKTE